MKTEISKSEEQKNSNKSLLQLVHTLISDGYKTFPTEDKIPLKKIKSWSKLRQRPLHHLNYLSVFGDAIQYAIITGDHLEVIDVDCKYDKTGKLWSSLIAAIKYCLPEVYEKIIIVRTQSGGYHIYYKCKQIGGNQKLAGRPATAAELAFGERFKTLIETRGEGGYIIGPGSEGYAIEHGDLSEIDYISQEDRAQLFAICKSFDKISKPQLTGISSFDQRKENTPWVVFNNEHDWEWMLAELIFLGWENISEDDEKVTLKRPGTNAKSSGTLWKESNILYVFSTSTEFEAEKPYSAFGIICQMKYDGNVRACALDLAQQGIGTWSNEEGEFHSIDSKGKVVPKYAEIVVWMKEIGLFKFWYSQGEYNVVQVVEKVVKFITTDQIKKIFGDYLKSTVEEKVYNFFLPRLVSIFSEKGIISQLENLDETKFIKSTATEAWVFYQSTALKIVADAVLATPYELVEGYIWDRNIIKRNYSDFEIEGDTCKFIRLISGNRKEIELRFRCAIGYLLHKYKDPANPRVIILNDEFFDEDNDFEPQGGTGKGLLIKFLSYFMNTYVIDGKNFNINKSFPFQGLGPDTELMAIEDALKNFDFERFFSIVTDGITVEKKGKDEYTISFDRSPKMLITTNYAIKGSSSSHLRRRYELEVAAFFSHKNRPIDHFGHRFFVDWDEEEWLRFDNYMVQCLQMFLSQGLPEQLTINLEKKKLIQETNRDFTNWIDKVYEKKSLPTGPVTKDAFMNQFTEMYHDYNVKLTQSKFTKWLNRWCESKNIKLDSSNSYNGKMCYSFKQPKTIIDGQFYEVSHEVSPDVNLVKDSIVPQNLVNGWKGLDIEELF